VGSFVLAGMGILRPERLQSSEGLGNVFSTPAEVTLVVPRTLDIVGIRLSTIQLGNLNRIRVRGVRSTSSVLDIE
jgi:hypothetical protein